MAESACIHLSASVRCLPTEKGSSLNVLATSGPVRDLRTLTSLDRSGVLAGTVSLDAVVVCVDDDAGELANERVEMGTQSLRGRPSEHAVTVKIPTRTRLGRKRVGGCGRLQSHTTWLTPQLSHKRVVDPHAPWHAVSAG